MNRRDLLVLGLAAFAFSDPSYAADKSDPTGTWKWSYTDENEQKVDVSLKLKHEKDKLTGTITLPNKKDIEITNPSFKDGNLKFDVKQVPGKNDKNTTWFVGKVDGDKITGTFETWRFGFEWQAKRIQNEKKTSRPY